MVRRTVMRLARLKAALGDGLVVATDADRVLGEDAGEVMSRDPFEPFVLTGEDTASEPGLGGVEDPDSGRLG